MASNKTGMKDAAGSAVKGSLAGTLLKMTAAGVTGGVLLIAGAKTAGEKLLEMQKSSDKKLEEKRAADREEVRRIMENETEADQ